MLIARVDAGIADLFVATVRPAAGRRRRETGHARPNVAGETHHKNLSAKREVVTYISYTRHV